MARGPNWRELPFSRNSKLIEFESCNRLFFLRVVNTYKHVGTAFSANNSISEEVVLRCGIMRNESRKLFKDFLKNREVSIDKKILVIQAYIISKGSFQCGTWPCLSDVLYKKFHSSLLSVYRRAVGNYYKKGEWFDVDTLFTDDELIHKYHFMCPRTIIRLARLALFSRVLVKGPQRLLQLAIATQSYDCGWANAVFKDLHWLCLSPTFSECSSYTFSQWVDFLSGSPKTYFNAIRKYCK